MSVVYTVVLYALYLCIYITSGYALCCTVSRNALHLYSTSLSSLLYIAKLSTLLANTDDLLHQMIYSMRYSMRYSTGCTTLSTVLLSVLLRYSYALLYYIHYYMYYTIGALPYAYTIT